MIFQISYLELLLSYTILGTFLENKKEESLTKVILLFTYWNKKTIFRKIQLIFDIENWIFAIFHGPEGVGSNWYQKIIWLQVIYE